MTAQTDLPARRLRIAHVLIQPVLVWDDGEELEAGPEAGPLQVKLSEMAGMAEKLRADVAKVEAGQTQAPSPGIAMAEG